MPYTPKAHRFFEAIAHGMKPKDGGPSVEDAKKMASEGVKDEKKSRMQKLYKDTK